MQESFSRIKSFNISLSNEKINQLLLNISFVLILTILFVSVDAFSASTGSGTLIVTNNGQCNGDGFSDFRFPKWWDVYQDGTVHLNITPGYMICTSGVGNKINDKCDSDSDCSDNKGSCATSTNNCTGNPKTCQITGGTCSSNSDCPAVQQCSPSSPLAGSSCTNDEQCHIAGRCESALECSGPASVFIVGINGNACEEDSDCIDDNEIGCDTGSCDEGLCSMTGDTCSTDADCTGFCEFKDEIEDADREGNGEIDVCYDTPAGMCLDAKVYYCDEDTEANVHVAAPGQSFVATLLRAVASTDGIECEVDFDCEAPGATGKCVDGTCDSPITQCGLVMSDCMNEVGSFCCGLSQGAYGAPNSIATSLNGLTYGECDTNDPMKPAPGSGFLPAAACLGCDVFDGDPNGTTIGIHGIKSVTIDDLITLQSYLPAGGTPGKFKSIVKSDTHYGSIPDLNPSGTASKGQGGGSLSGQTMACAINTFLSNCNPAFGGNGSFTGSGFDKFELPEAGVIVCTKRSGSDKVLGTDDDICQAFAYPACVAGKTVAEVNDCANEYLATGANECGCSAGELNVSLNNINTEFDQCGEVIKCSVTSPGPYTCQ